MSSVPQYETTPPPISDEAKIQAILRQLCVFPASSVESEVLEVKGWCSDEKHLAEKVSEAAMCLANKSGGTVLVGIEDGSANSFSACPYPNVRCDWISQRIHDNTVPPVDVLVRDISDALTRISGKANVNAFTVRVEKTSRPGGHQTVAGLAKIRDGNRCLPYYFAEDDRSKAPIAAAAASDLSLTSIEWGIERYQKKFKIPQDKWRSPYDFLLELALIERFCPQDRAASNSFRVTLAGLLLFGKQTAISRHFPSCETLVVTPKKDYRFPLNIVETYREICGTRNSLMFSLCPNVPDQIVKELVVNAFIHRSYRVSAPVKISTCDDHLRIESPGELPGQLTPDMLIHCTPVYRNFLLAEGSRYIGICDKVGRGIDRVYEYVLASGFGFPAFESSNGHFVASVPLEGSAEFKGFIRSESQPLLSLDEMIVLRFLYDRESATFSELYSVMQRGTETGQKVLEEMFRKLMIEPVDGATERWRMAPNVRTVILNIFKIDQMRFGFGDLFGDS